MQDDEDTYIAAMRRAQERTQAVVGDAIRALDKLIQEQQYRMTQHATRFESVVLQPYRDAGSPYGGSRAAAMRWYREQDRKRPQ